MIRLGSVQFNLFERIPKTMSAAAGEKESLCEKLLGSGESRVIFR